MLYNIIILHPKSFQLCLTLQHYGPKSTRLLCPWDSPGKSTGAGCHFLLQGVFPFQGSNLCLMHLLRFRQILSQWAIEEAPVQCGGGGGGLVVKPYPTLTIPWIVAC